MPREKLTDSEILNYDNVPIPAAAAYLGCSEMSLRDALRDRRAPFGYSVKGDSERSKWMTHISPGQLVAYKNGTLPTLDEGRIAAMLVETVERILDLRSRAALEVLAPRQGGPGLENGNKEVASKRKEYAL